MMPAPLRRGFTLIELLVVVSIVGFLSAFVLQGVNDARMKSRDARRLQELQQLRTALEGYYGTYGQYPVSCGNTTNTWRGHGSNYGNCDTDYVSGITAQMSPLPIDPQGDLTNGYLYRVSSDRQQYKIMSYFKIEKGTVTKGTPYARCPDSCSNSYCSQNTYAIYTPGAACW